MARTAELFCELKWVMQAHSDGNKGMKFPVLSAFCCSLFAHCAENQAYLAEIGKVNRKPSEFCQIRNDCKRYEGVG